MKVNPQASATSMHINSDKKDAAKLSNSAGGLKAKAANLSDSVKVDISEQARDVQKVKDMVGDVNEVNAEKVARLQNLIDSGQYKMDASAVADRILDEHLKMS